MEDSDIALQVPVRIFEHYVIIKAWSVLAEYLRDNVADEDLIDYHIKEASYLFPTLETQWLADDLEQRKRIVEKLIAEASSELTLKDPTSEEESKQTRSVLLAYNKQAARKADEIVRQCMKEARLMNESVHNI